MGAVRDVRGKVRGGGGRVGFDARDTVIMWRVCKMLFIFSCSATVVAWLPTNSDSMFWSLSCGSIVLDIGGSGGHGNACWGEEGAVWVDSDPLLSDNAK